jgi:iron complex transport system substrate-binding protein
MKAASISGILQRMNTLLFLLCFQALLFISSCSFSSPGSREEMALTVTDFRARETVLSKPAERVVCLIESALAGIYMLGQEHRLVAVPSNVYGKGLHGYYARLDSRIKEKILPTPGNWDFISMEQIAGLNPDLVIIWASQAEAIANIERLGIPVYAVMMHGFDDVYKEIKDFGVLFDCRERADSLIETTRSRLDEIQARFENENPKSVYFMWAQGITETSGLNSTVNELLQISGTVNACPLEPEHVSVSVEKLYDWDPDMIVMWHNDRLDPEDIIANPLLQGLKAVQNRRIYELPGIFSCDFWTLKMQYPAQLIASWAYSCPVDADLILADMYIELYGINLLN